MVVTMCAFLIFNLRLLLLLFCARSRMVKSPNGNVRICIVGAGLAGTMMAILLAKLGYRVTVYEKREDPRVVTVFLDINM